MDGRRDHFETLGLERRLDLEEESLRTRYDERCREVHPDAGGEAGEFDAVREAYACLSSPMRRLRHWLELAGVEVVEGGSLPGSVVDRFGEIGTLLRETEELAKRHGSARSALGRSVVEAEGLALQVRLGEVRGGVESAIGELVALFAEFEAAGARAVGEEAAETARALAFLEKWEGQLRAAWAQAGCW